MIVFFFSAFFFSLPPPSPPCCRPLEDDAVCDWPVFGAGMLSGRRLDSFQGPPVTCHSSFPRPLPKVNWARAPGATPPGPASPLL